MDGEAYAARVLRLPDGTEIFTREWAVPHGVAPRGSGLIVHGYDLRGHGRSEGPRGSIPSDDALLDDLRFVFERIEPLPVVLGHSLGGTPAAPARARRLIATAA